MAPVAVRVRLKVLLGSALHVQGFHNEVVEVFYPPGELLHWPSGYHRIAGEEKRV
jgi:hypothetical protein